MAEQGFGESSRCILELRGVRWGARVKRMFDKPEEEPRLDGPGWHVPARRDTDRHGEGRLLGGRA